MSWLISVGEQRPFTSESHSSFPDIACWHFSHSLSMPGDDQAVKSQLTPSRPSHAPAPLCSGGERKWKSHLCGNTTWPTWPWPCIFAKWIRNLDFVFVVGISLVSLYQSFFLIMVNTSYIKQNNYINLAGFGMQRNTDKDKSRTTNRIHPKWYVKNKIRWKQNF